MNNKFKNEENDMTHRQTTPLDHLQIGPRSSTRRPPQRSAVRSLIQLTLFAWLPLGVLATTPAATEISTSETTTAGTTTDETAEHRPVIEAEIVVTAGNPELVNEERVEGSRVDSEAADIGQYLRLVTGASSIRRGPINLEPTVRGLQEDQVAVLVDGTRTFAAGPGRMDSNLSHVGPHAVGGLRLVKGPYALTWGAGALSAIALDTWRPAFSSDDWQWNGRLGASVSENAGAVDARLGLWGGGERFRFRLDAGQRAGDDYEAGDGSRVAADYESTDTRLRLGFQPSVGWLIELSGGYQEQNDLDYPGRLLDATYFHTRSYNLELVREGRGRIRQIQAQVYANHKDHRMNNDEKPTARDMPGRIPPFGLRVDLPAESNTTGGRLRIDLAENTASRRAWAFGVDAYEVDQNARRTISRRSNGFVLFEDIVWPDASLQDLGAWGQLVHQGDGYRLAATLRLDTVDTKTGELSPFFVANTVADTDPEETHVSAALSAIFDMGRDSQLTLGVGRAVRTASVLERYSDRFPATKFQLAAEFMGNPGLDPEQSLEADLGWRTRHRDLVFEADVFYRVIDDYITVEAAPELPRRLPLSPPTVFRYVNGDQATYWGGELKLRQRVDEHWSWQAAVAYVRAQDKALDEPVLGIAPLGGRAGLRYTTLGGDLWVEGTVRFADRQDRVATSRFEQATPGWAVYDLSASWRIDERWGLRLDVENLGDHAYTQHLDSPNPFTGQRILEIGREIRLGFELGF